MSRLLLSTLFSFLFLVLSHIASASEITYGTISNNIYKNDYFGMSMDVPQGWSVQSKAAMKQLMDQGSDLVAGDDQNLKAIMKQSEKQTVNMFVFFKYEQGTPVTFNPSIVAVAERVTHMPGIKRGADYFFHVRRLLQASQVEYTFPKKIYTTDLSGVSFDVMPAEISASFLTVEQDYYAALMKDYVLNFILSYSNEDEKQELIKILDTVSFR
jgi:hypothetical protein